jgi:hypothetical protein
LLWNLFLNYTLAFPFVSLDYRLPLPLLRRFGRRRGSGRASEMI